MRIISLVMVIFMAMTLSACTGETVYAPVTDVSTIEKIPQDGAYQVMQGDTLYSIAWRYGLDFRYLAKRNNISEPYHIQNGQFIYLSGKGVRRTTHAFTQARQSRNARSESAAEREPCGSVRGWRWPAHGPVLATYSQINKGINIGGHYGAPIVATAPGRVVYSGNGLRMYGELIIIKHNNLFLSAYAYNSKILVREGDWVKAGQNIAEMGFAARRQPMLHFEIRRGGQPVNPLSYLGKK